MTTAISRRHLFRSAGLVAGALATAPLLQACDARGDVKRLTWLNWQDYIDPDTIPDFERSTGIDVTYQTYESNDELERLLIQAGRPRLGGRSPVGYDLIVPSDNFIARFRDLDLLEELDHDALTGLDNLAPEFRDAGFDPGNRYSVPWATGTTGIGYDATVLSEPPGYEIFLDEQYAGRMTVLNEVRDAFAVALFSLGEDPNSRTQTVIEAAADRLQQMKEVIRGFDSDTYLDDLASGDLVAAHAYSSDVLQAKQRNPNLEFTLTDQGALRWVDSLAIPAQAAHRSNAERLMSYFLRPEVSAHVSEFIRADTGNEAALELLPAAVRDDPIIFPAEEVLSTLVFTQDLGEDEDLYADAWERVQDG